ncbi:MAG: hypothetical protein IPJ48_21635 [Propionivibrio sp.]|uniref:Uncharacterized protein n=1 Tax=Candidatus Propionivibrio dominans TaxID=2954373 RepID=A0A9D7I9J9_9RHOO|nr:hypothetical protein [Candidatus Propionivibrio dominans]
MMRVHRLAKWTSWRSGLAALPGLAMNPGSRASAIFRGHGRIPIVSIAPDCLFAEEIVALWLAVEHFLALQKFTEDT